MMATGRIEVYIPVISEAGKTDMVVVTVEGKITVLPFEEDGPHDLKNGQPGPINYVAVESDGTKFTWDKMVDGLWLMGQQNVQELHSGKGTS